MVTETDIVIRIEIAAHNSGVYKDILLEAASKITTLREERYRYIKALEEAQDITHEALKTITPQPEKSEKKICKCGHDPCIPHEHAGFDPDKDI